MNHFEFMINFGSPKTPADADHDRLKGSASQPLVVRNDSLQLATSGCSLQRVVANNE